MRPFTWIVGILIVILIIALVWNYYSDDDELPVNGETARRTVTGTVTNVNVDQVPVDGPALVTVRTTAGASETIAIPTFGILLCEAEEIDDFDQLVVGDTVSASGSIDEEGRIVPCESAEDYFRVTSATGTPNGAGTTTATTTATSTGTTTQ